MRWIYVTKRLPKVKEGEDESKNVFAFTEDARLRIMAYCFIADGENSGWAWCDCNGHIHGDPEFDDDYKVTHWMPLPNPPLKDAEISPEEILKSKGTFIPNEDNPQVEAIYVWKALEAMEQYAGQFK